MSISSSVVDPDPVDPDPMDPDPMDPEFIKWHPESGFGSVILNNGYDSLKI